MPSPKEALYASLSSFSVPSYVLILKGLLPKFGSLTCSYDINSRTSIRGLTVFQVSISDIRNSQPRGFHSQSPEWSSFSVTRGPSVQVRGAQRTFGAFRAAPRFKLCPFSSGRKLLSLELVSSVFRGRRFPGKPPCTQRLSFELASKSDTYVEKLF